MDAFAEYEQHDAVGLAAAVRDGHVTAPELLDAAIARIERRNPSVNAVVTTAFDRARRAIDDGLPDGPLRGVPYLLKDLNHAWAGVRMTDGSRALRDYVPGYSATLVRRLEAAGLVALGMTNVPEFGITPVTEPELHGVCANPWDLTRTAGGSSGGSGAAVAAGMVPAASASDGGGSIRIPASHCGLFGLKPTRARTPSGPVGAEGWFGLSVSHALTRSVRDSAVLLDVTHGAEPGDPYAAPALERPFAAEVGADPGTLRVGVVDGGIFHGDTHPECRAAAVAATDLVGDLGHEVVPFSLDIDRASTIEAMLLLLAASTAAALDDVARLQGHRAPQVAQYELRTWLLRLIGRRVTGQQAAAALNHLRAVGRMVATQLSDTGVDVILTSTLAEPPMRHRALDPQPAEHRVLELLRRVPVRPVLMAMFWTLAQRLLEPIPSLPVFNITGQPAMSVPLHWTPDGLPIGVQFAGHFGHEATLFRLAAQLEAAHPWFDRRPPLLSDRTPIGAG
jgi:amidase